MQAFTLPPEATGADIQAMHFAWSRSPDQDAAVPARHPVVVVGAGPVGLSLAIDLAQRGVQVLVLDNDDRLSNGSRAICFAKRTLEIFDRLGVADACAAKGVSWNVGRVFFGEEQVYQFDLLPEPGHERPAFVNLQQYYVEAYLLERASQLPNIEIRWKNTVTGVQSHSDSAQLQVDTPEGAYKLDAAYVAACDGSRSAVRQQMGLESKGRVFKDRFLIADVKMAIDFPAERWFWFDPPFHPNQSVLLHRQPDHVWRIDFQLGWDADPEEEKKPERITPRVNAMLRQALGREVPFALEWASVYTFSCQRMDSFRHGRVFFAGDSAHGVSPFGARGANSGVQDADNLAWKLAAVLGGQAHADLLDTYGSEREYAADENILNSSRSTDFITPKSDISRLFRNAVLELAREHSFAQQIVNSGRLSVPARLHASVLNTSDGESFSGAMLLGAVAVDAPVTLDGRATWLLQQLGPDFTLLVYGAPAQFSVSGLDSDLLKILRIVYVLPSDASAPEDGTVYDARGFFGQRYGAKIGSAWLLRPDRHLCARWRNPGVAGVRAALHRCLALQAA